MQQISHSLTGSLEDYLESIYEVVQDKKLARVRDIAKKRGVRAASVTLAMKRLAELGLIEYVQREYIDLTERGTEQARRIFARHVILARFFEDVLCMPAAAAETDACAIEHNLSPDAMDRLVRFVEFLKTCPEGNALLAGYHRFSADAAPADPDIVALSTLMPGDRARVSYVQGRGGARKRLLDSGILPDVLVSVERVEPETGAVQIKLHGFQLPLGRNEAASVMVSLLQLW